MRNIAQGCRGREHNVARGEAEYYNYLPRDHACESEIKIMVVFTVH